MYTIKKIKNIVIVVILFCASALSLSHVYCFLYKTHKNVSIQESPKSYSAIYSDLKNDCRVVLGSKDKLQSVVDINGSDMSGSDMICRYQLHSDLPIYTFYLQGKISCKSFDCYVLDNIIFLKDETNSLKQLFSVNAMIMASPKLVDANFDGYKDIQILADSSKNWTYIFLIFDPKSQTFHINKELGELSRPSFDQETKTIISSYVGGWGIHPSATYEYDNLGRLKLLKEENSDY